MVFMIFLGLGLCYVSSNFIMSPRLSYVCKRLIIAIHFIIVSRTKVCVPRFTVSLANSILELAPRLGISGQACHSDSSHGL
jgi:hypothetical protein